MQTIHDIKSEKIIALVHEIASFIRLNDNTYERELQQGNRIVEMVANLNRYANAIEERKNQNELFN